MDESNGAQSGSQSELGKLIAESQPDRNKLRQQVDPLFQQLWTDVLHMLEEIFPHDVEKTAAKGLTEAQRTANARLFTAYRHRVLREGNGKIRELEKILGCFYLKQLMIRETTVRALPRQGPFNLPTNVKMPSERPA